MTLNPAPRHLEVTFKGSKKTIFMSFGLLSRITNIIGGPNEWTAVATSPDTQYQILQELLCVRDPKTAQVTEDVSLDEIDMELSEIEKTLDWVGEHLIGFFTQRVQRSLDQVTRSNQALEKYKPTSGGSSV